MPDFEASRKQEDGGGGFEVASQKLGIEPMSVLIEPAENLILGEAQIFSGELTVITDMMPGIDDAVVLVTGGLSAQICAVSAKLAADLTVAQPNSSGRSWRGSKIQFLMHEGNCSRVT